MFSFIYSYLQYTRPPPKKETWLDIGQNIKFLEQFKNHTIHQIYDGMSHTKRMQRSHFTDVCARSVETEYHEMLFWLETEHSDKELYWIIAQSRPVQMISY